MNKIFLTTLLMLTAFCGQLAAQFDLDDRIDNLQKLIAKTPSDTGKVRLYQLLMSNFYKRYVYRGAATVDSLAMFRTAATCRTLCKKINDARGWGNCLIAEAKFYAQAGNLPMRDERFKEAFSVLQAANDKPGLADAYLYKGQIHPASDTTSTKLGHFQTALQLSRESNNRQTETMALRFIADIHQKQGKHEQAVKELLHVAELQKKLDNYEIHVTTDLLTHVYAISGRHKEAMQSALTTIEYARQARDTVYFINYYRRLAYLYSDIKDYQQSFNYFAKALAIMIPGRSAFLRAAILSTTSSMINCLVNMNRYEEGVILLSETVKKSPPTDDLAYFDIYLTYLDLYHGLKKYKLAEENLVKLLQHRSAYEFNPSLKIMVYTRAGQLYITLQKWEQAARYGDSAYTVALSLNAWRQLYDNAWVLYRAYQEKGDYQTALKHFENFKTYSDSMQNDIADKHTKELVVKYETDQKNKELAQLATQSKLQQDAIRKGRAFRNAMIAAACLLLLLLLLAFNRYRVKQKANRLLQQKQEEINSQNQVLEKMVDDEKKITAEKEKLLVEKEWLVKEINHRVKNNLQVVMSLLDTQRIYLKDEAALNAINESQHRLQAISLIHKKLYQNDEIGTAIDMSSYIKEVTEYLSDSLDVDHRIKVNLLLEQVELDVSQAVPLGLIINEAFTNAVKYAFPGKRSGVVTIDMQKNADGMITLWIRDNGIGLPDQFDWQHTDSLGISLMQGLTQQIDGQFELLNKEGLTIKISFKPAKSLE